MTYFQDVLESFRCRSFFQIATAESNEDRGCAVEAWLNLLCLGLNQLAGWKKEAADTAEGCPDQACS